MARFSLPNDEWASNGRFKVWDSTSDKYNHEELQKNWDTLHAIIGGNSNWPTTRGAAGGIYKEIANVSADLTPLGSVIAWWRPTSSVTVPTGWVPCDGRSVAAVNHSYGGGAIQVPDLRNRFILGALSPDGGSSGTPGGTYSYGSDGNAGSSSDTPTAAPTILVAPSGGGSTPQSGGGGTNAGNAHTHTLPHHYHSHVHLHEVQGDTGDGTSNPDRPVATGGASPSAARYSHNHSVNIDSTIARDSSAPATGRPHTSLPVWDKTGAAVAFDVTDIDNPKGGQNVASTNAQNLSAAQKMVTDAATYDPRPQYVGLLYLIKVKRTATT